MSQFITKRDCRKGETKQKCRVWGKTAEKCGTFFDQSNIYFFRLLAHITQTDSSSQNGNCEDSSKFLLWCFTHTKRNYLLDLLSKYTFLFVG